MIIFHPGQEAEAVRSATDRFSAIVTDRGGSISRVDQWGRRRFAYDVKHLKDGQYVVVEMTASREAVTELDRVLSINDEVVRHKIVRLPDTGIPAIMAASEEETPDRSETPRGEGVRG
jgi:small subunit ribosomal protein S6